MIMRLGGLVYHSVISIMDRDQIAENFISAIKREFPDVGERIDKQIEALELEPEDKMYTQMFECFSQATTDAIKEKNSETASKHLNYMSNKLKNASEVEREYIDVYYTEPLMWDIKDRKLKSWGLKLFPANIKKLYEGMWGDHNL
jgi:hypothetical protein